MLLNIASAILVFLLITTSHVMVGELVSKQVAIGRAEHLLLSLAQPLPVLHVVSRPLRRTVSPRVRAGSGDLPDKRRASGFSPVLLSGAGCREDRAPHRVRGFEEGFLKTANITWADTERGREPTGTCIRTGHIHSS